MYPQNFATNKIKPEKFSNLVTLDFLCLSKARFEDSTTPTMSK